jgi:anti-anti-sigma factor
MPGTEEEGGRIVVLAGRVDVSTVSRIRDRLHNAVDSGTGEFVVDLAAVESIDATGLGMLVGTQRRAVRAGRTMVLRAVPTRVARLLQVTKLSRVLPSESDHPASVA